MATHEYAVIGHNKARIGRWLGIIAGAIAGLGTLAGGFFSELALKIGLAESWTTWLAVPISATLVYSIVYSAFDHFAWRCIGIKHLLNVPNLSGKWSVKGETLKDDQVVYEWDATITIVQTWDKIQVALKTKQSGSDSTAASVIRDPARGYVLMYSYRNQPRIGEAELQHHVGYCELVFDHALKAAQGHYFNNLGRFTYGRMTLERSTTK